MSHHKINTSLLILKECPYTASSRDALENTPTSALEISLGWGFCTPRPSRLPSGFALGQSLGPRGAKSPPLGNLLGLGECIFQYIPPLGSVRIQYNMQDCPNLSLSVLKCVSNLMWIKVILPTYSSFAENVSYLMWAKVRQLVTGKIKGVGCS